MHFALFLGHWSARPGPFNGRLCTTCAYGTPYITKHSNRVVPGELGSRTGSSQRRAADVNECLGRGGKTVVLGKGSQAVEEGH